MNRQWHPLFARLLGIQLGAYYEIEPEFPVSDLPRAGDFLVVRRQPGPSPPFQGLWNYLTDVNVIEFKGRTDDASPEDLEKFMAVGTGIAYRLNEKRWARKEASLDPRTVSFWYIAPMLGPTFLDAVRRRIPRLEYETGGLYSTRCWGHPLFFVSARDMVVEEDTVPLWLVEGDPAPKAVGEFVVRHEASLRQFAAWLARLQPSLWQEVRHMMEFSDLIDWKAVAKAMDWEKFGPAIDLADLVPHLPAEQVVRTMGVEKTFEALLSQLSVEQLQEMLKRRQQQAAPPGEGTPS